MHGGWTEEEDATLVTLVNRYGARKWSVLASYLPGRLGRQCRDRWVHHLAPELKHGEWDPREDRHILNCVREWGAAWAAIARELPGRTDNMVKNRYYSTLVRMAED